MAGGTQETIYYLNREDRGTAPTKLWLLLEYNAFNGKTTKKTHEVVEAKDVRGAGGPDNPNFEAMHTGKLVYIQRNNLFVQATIVTISDDKQFLDQELKDLRELELRDSFPTKKRRRETGSKADKMYNAFHKWNGKVEKESSPSPASTIVNRPVAAPQPCPPMTFDQQTQTDFKGNFDGAGGPNDAKLTQIVLTNESILQAQNGLIIENQEMKLQVSDMSKQLSEVKSMLGELLSKFTRPESRNGTAGDKVLISANPVEPFTPTSNRAHFNQPKILNLSNQPISQHTPPTPFSSTIIEPIEASNDSTYSYSNNSRISRHASNQSISNQSIYQNDFSPNRSNGDQPEKVFVQTIKIDRLPASQSQTNLNDIDVEGNPEDEVVIGNNNTTIPRHVLTNINWNSHTNATRRLLKEKFSRETLATHSLTGKPSPGKQIFKYVTVKSVVCHSLNSQIQI